MYTGYFVRCAHTRKDFLVTHLRVVETLSVGFLAIPCVEVMVVIFLLVVPSLDCSGEVDGGIVSGVQILSVVGVNPITLVSGNVGFNRKIVIPDLYRT